MAISQEAFPGIVKRWDIPPLVNDPNNTVASWVAQKRLSPTVALAANWALKGGASTYTYIWDIDMASDTQIEYNMGPAPDPGFTNTFIGKFGNGPGAVNATYETAVAASGPLNYTYQGGFCPAGKTIHLLNKSWIVLIPSQTLYLFTTTVAANCWLNIYFAEFLA